MASFAVLVLGPGAARLAFAQTPPQCTAVTDPWTVNAYVNTSAGGNAVTFTPVGGTEYFQGNCITGMAFNGNLQGTPYNFGGSTSTLTSSSSGETSVNLGITSTNIDSSVSADANARSNLATGSVGVSASSNQVGVSAGSSQAYAALEDTLTFTVTGASAATVSSSNPIPITVQLTIEGENGGVTSSVYQYTEGNSIITNAGSAQMTGSLNFGAASITTGWLSDADDNNGSTAPINDGATGGTGWDSVSVVDNSATDIVVDGTYDLTSASTSVDLLLLLSCETAGVASCDYSDTESVSFVDLPSDVSFTSASGVFLSSTVTTSVPEPGSLPLFATALALGWALRRRKSASVE